MNQWFIAAIALSLAYVPCGWVCARGRVLDGLVAFEMSGLISVLLVVVLAEAYGRPSLYDLALALALLSLPSGLVFAHFLERWL